MCGQNLDSIRTQVCIQTSSTSHHEPCPSCLFILGTGSRPFRGGQCDIFALKNHEGHPVGIRIFREPGPISEYILKNELEFRREIERQGIRLFQKILAFSEFGNNLVKNPFISLEWARGDHLIWNESFPPHTAQRERVIRTLANVSLDLLKVQESCISAKKETADKIQRKIVRAETGSYPGGDLKSCVRQMNLLEEYWIPQLDQAPRVLVHGDLSPNNIIIDEEYNVQSIIDLGWAEMVPLQFAAVYPSFLTHEPVSGPSRSNISFNWLESDSKTMRNDRFFFRKCIEERAMKEGGIYQLYYEILSREDEVRRYWWFKAISEADKHKAMDACSWNPDQPADS